MITLTLRDIFDKEHIDEGSVTANLIYVIRNGSAIFYVGKTTRGVQNRILDHCGNGPRCAFPDSLGKVILDNQPASLCWQVDVYDVTELFPVVLENSMFEAYLSIAEQNMINKFNPALNQIYNGQHGMVEETSRGKGGALKISKSIEVWYQSFARQKKHRKSRVRSDTTSLVVEHAALPNTAMAYQDGVDRFLKMLIENGITPGNDISRITMEHFIQFPSWLSHCKSIQGKEIAKSTKRVYIGGVEKYRQWLQLQGLLDPTPNEMARFISARDSALSDQGRNNIRKVNENDVCAVLDASRTCDEASPLKERNIAVVHLMYHSGLRVTEISRLKVRDIHLEDLCGVIVEVGKEETRFWFDQTTAQYIESYWKARRWGIAPDDPAFAAHDKSAGKKHRHLTRTALYQSVQELANLAGVKVYPQAFRQAFVINTYQKTKDLAFTQAVARHGDIGSTQRYARLTTEEIEKKYRAAHDQEDEGESGL